MLDDIPLGPSALGDVNGDGNLDAVFLPGTYIAVALGDGAGNLNLVPEFYATGHTTQPGVDLFLADFEGDGIADAGVITRDQVAILHGVGDGSFGMGEVHTLGGSLFRAFIDFNQDGRTDLVEHRLGDMPGIAQLLRTPGAFEDLMSLLPHPMACYVANLSIADLNGDERPDLLAVGGCNSVFPDTPVAVYLGTQDSLQFLGEFAAGVDPVVPSTGDYSGDGVTDIIVGNGVGCDVSLLQGVGDGSFAPQEVLSLEPASAPCRTLVRANLAQLDGLGPHEILVDYFPGEEVVSFDPRRFYAVMDANGPGESWLWLAEGSIIEIGDLNNDGVDDIFFKQAYSKNQLSILLSNP